MELAGGWVATEADDDVRRHGIGLDADDTDWIPVEVPGHWQQTPKLAASDGPIMYRRRFRAAPPAAGRRRWITLDGIFYQADVWLDGAYIGDPEGYFFPHTLDVTALSALGDEHVLAVEATCPRPAPDVPARTLTGVFQDPSLVGGRWNPGGLWRPVLVYDTGPVRIDRLRVLCRDADPRRAHLRIAVRLDSEALGEVVARTFLDGELADEQAHPVAAGDNELEWSLDVTDPSLWWPRALGDQPLVDVAVEVAWEGATSDRRSRRTGLRQVEWKDWTCTVNGERLFLKGANVLPTRAHPAEATDELVRRDVELAVELGLDALRVRGHIAHRQLYRAADELGILLLQDFPLRGQHARAIRRQAVDQARAAVDFLGHHPSIASWTAHDDPTGTPPAGSGWRAGARRVASQQLPSWNRTVLDRWVKRSFERADETRRTVAQSGAAPHLPQLDGTDSHLWFGWHKGEATDLAGFAARAPRRVRFVSEFGAHSAPSSAPFLDEQVRTRNWPDLDWGVLEAEYGYDRTTFERLFPPDDFATLEDWRETTQHYQAHLLKVQIEALRRLKYRPTGGFCLSSLADPAPLVSTGLFDHERVAKPAAAVVRAACAPLLVVLDQPPDLVEPGTSLHLDVHLVSDLRHDLDFAVVDVAAGRQGDPSAPRRWRFGGPVPADDVVKVGELDLVVPPSDDPGEHTLAIDVTLSAGEHHGHNHYLARIGRPVA